MCIRVLLAACLTCAAAASSVSVSADGAFSEALVAGDAARVRAMLEYDPGLASTTDDRGRPALHLAAQSGNAAVIKLLLDRGADVNGACKYGRTALIVATCANKIDAMKALIAAGANVNARDNTGKTALHWAGYEGRPWFHDETVTSCYMEAGRVLLDSGAEIGARDKLGATPLHTAAWFGCVKLAELLISKGADVNAANHNGSTPLHNAAFRGNAEMARLLIDAGADLNPTDRRGRSPLAAAFAGHSDKADVVRVLQEAGGR